MKRVVRVYDLRLVEKKKKKLSNTRRARRGSRSSHLRSFHSRSARSTPGPLSFRYRKNIETGRRQVSRRNFQFPSFRASDAHASVVRSRMKKGRRSCACANTNSLEGEIISRSVSISLRSAYVQTYLRYSPGISSISSRRTWLSPRTSSYTANLTRRRSRRRRRSSSGAMCRRVINRRNKKRTLGVRSQSPRLRKRFDNRAERKWKRSWVGFVLSRFLSAIFVASCLESSNKSITRAIAIQCNI